MLQAIAALSAGARDRTFTSDWLQRSKDRHRRKLCHHLSSSRKSPHLPGHGFLVPFTGALLLKRFSSASFLKIFLFPFLATPGVWSSPARDWIRAVCALDKPASPSETPEVLRVSTKQCIANFFSRPTEGVQALVGGYIGGLVPKLKYEAKSQSEEQEEVLKAEQAVSGDRSTEEKRRLSLQREKASCSSVYLHSL